ncbi:acyl-CoA carboxylase epsilon subunit [Labedaea rhizosphaerae]|uniref:Acyl-CoA carboxylase epsilon subunit-like protein n=1 Tax=Labedaea rhizosphaerae TaxID=598644 RepID=A0A4R6SJ98_LABRH|nr:acyl-CoA carboxylase epsilon subunit [Labedaea rhizosphaerae]TDQ04386.1 acyl-CoA carboxylase epsilon subunit-like protein [Labedaea rhizosphaerae]
MTEIKILRGNPDDSELAALAVVLAAVTTTSRPAPVPGPERAHWDRPARFQPPGASAGPWWW